MKLEVHTLYTKIKLKDRKLLSRIDRNFAVPVDGHWFSPQFKKNRWDGREHFFNRLTQKIPTGLLNELESWLKQQGIEYKVKDHRKLPQQKVEPIPDLRGGVSLYDYQVGPFEKALQMQRGILWLATNSGKTIIAAAMINSLLQHYGNQARMIVLAGSKDIVLQTQDKLRQLLGRDIGIFGAGKRKMKNVNVATVQTCLSVLKVKPNFMDMFNVVFFDECHHTSSKTWYHLAMKSSKAEWRFGMSGTAISGDYEKDWRLMSATGPVIAKVSNEKLIEEGYSAKPIIVFQHTPHYEVRLEKGTWAEVAQKLITKNEPRNNLIVKLAIKRVKKGASVMILTPYVTHGKTLQKMLKERGIKTVFNWGQVSRNRRRSQLKTFKKNKDCVMIATTIYDEGIDIPEITDLIPAGAGRSSRKLLQRVGRALRKKEQGENRAIIWEFIDECHPWLASQSAARLKVHLKEGFEVKGYKPRDVEWLKKVTSRTRGLSSKTRNKKRKGRSKAKDKIRSKEIKTKNKKVKKRIKELLND